MYNFEPQCMVNNKVWISKTRNTPVIAKKDFRVRKMFFTVSFFNSKGPEVHAAASKGYSVIAKIQWNLDNSKSKGPNIFVWIIETLNNWGLKYIHTCIFKSGLQNDFDLLRILNYWSLNYRGSTVLGVQRLTYVTSVIHDNAPAHKSKIVQDYLCTECIEQLPPCMFSRAQLFKANDVVS